MIIRTRCGHYFYNCSISFWAIRNTFPEHFFACLPCRKTKQRCPRGTSQPSHCLAVPAEISNTSKNYTFLRDLQVRRAVTLRTIPTILDLAEMLVPRDHLVSSISHMGFALFLLSFHFLSSTQEERIPALSAVVEQTFLVWNFFPAIFFQDLFKLSFTEQSCPWVSVRISFTQSSLSPHDFGRRDRGGRWICAQKGKRSEHLLKPHKNETIGKKRTTTSVEDTDEL